MLRRIVLALSALIASAGLVLGAYGQQVPYSSTVYYANQSLTWPDGASITDNAGASLMFYGPTGVNGFLIGSGGNLRPITDSVGGLGNATSHWSTLFLSSTNTGTVGAVTMNVPSGRVNIAAAGTSVVVTDNIAGTNSHIFCNVSNVDSTAKACQVTPGAGTFTVTLGAPATAQVAIDFFIVSN